MYIAVSGTPSQSYAASRAMYGHTVLRQVNIPHSNLIQTGWYSIYLLQRDGRLS